MKGWFLGCVLAFAVLGSAQEKLDWSACESAVKSMNPQVEKWQKSLPDGFVLSLECAYEGTKEERKRLPERHIPLTRDEIRTLNEYRKAADAFSSAQQEFESYLLQAHHLPILNYDDPCFRFIGIVMDDDFITDDPNPMMPWRCQKRKGQEVKHERTIDDH